MKTGKRMRSKHSQAEALEDAFHWLRSRGIIEPASARDPETFARIHGFVLTEQLRDRIGSSLVRLMARAQRRHALRNLTIRDAFLTASLDAIMHQGDVALSQDEITRCASIILSLLPLAKLETAGIARKKLRSLVKSRSLVQQLQRVCSSSC